jgi:hypothetical protein
MASVADKLAILGIEPSRGSKFQPLSVEEVTSFEQRINARLPQTYREFLLTYGESTFSNTVNCTPTGKPLYFGWFYGLPGLLTALENYDEVLPENIIPIGSDEGDNQFCLGVKGEDVGKAYFHNHNIGWRADADRLLSEGLPVPSNISYQTVYEVASSFDQFIQNMVTED